MTGPKAIFNQQISRLSILLEQQTKKRRLLGWSRLMVFLATVFISYYSFHAVGFWGFLPMAAGLAILLVLVSVDVDNNQQISNTKTLIDINNDELQILDHQFNHRFSGSRFFTNTHAYANDLDIFGPASVFQWLNRTYTEQGQRLLASDLLHPLPPEEISSRQQAVKEIAPMIEWRQQLQSFAKQTPVTVEAEQRTINWLEEKAVHFVHPGWRLFVWFYTSISLGSVAALLTGFLPATAFSYLFFIFLISSLVLSRNTIKPYIALSKIVKEVSSLHRLIQNIEAPEFKSHLLQQLQQGIKPAQGTAAFQIKKLRIILDRFDLRLNIAGVLFFNSFLLWDVRQMMALNKWRKQNRQLAAKWFEAVAAMEVLNSLASVHISQPQWCFPEFSNEPGFVAATELGHPLIPAAARVHNNFFMQGRGKVAIITGSNMAGKSTFLRSLGVNMVLAQIGSPVCAARFALSPLQLISSMRIADNLAENTSTFYAELKKLKRILEAVGRQENLFILLDEILRGTNSLDRHTGSVALIRQLIKQQAVAVIATHDVALADMQQEYPSAIHNYHFDVQVSGEELFFDYKLKEGVCTSLNASLLMKKIGIELD